VRYCAEVKGANAVGFIDRGVRKEISFIAGVEHYAVLVGQIDERPVVSDVRLFTRHVTLGITFRPVVIERCLGASSLSPGLERPVGAGT